MKGSLVSSKLKDCLLPLTIFELNIAIQDAVCFDVLTISANYTVNSVSFLRTSKHVIFAFLKLGQILTKFMSTFVKNSASLCQKLHRYGERGN